MTSSTLIDAFVATYEREVDYYQEAARLCNTRCEALLGLRGVRAMITHRAKNPAKLRAKLEQRNKQRNYADIDAIRSDIVDLAGIRIALYFPGDQGRVSALIEENFSIKEKKIFPIPGNARPGKRFNGYYASHFRAQLTRQSLAPEQHRFADAVIEIQLGSVLMHAWAEVEHDLVYKPDSGLLSADEHAILDELNGLVLSGEIALERLQWAIERRLSSATATFDNHFELAAFLHKWVRERAPTIELAMGRVDALWQILRDAGMSSAGVLAPILSTLEVQEDGDTVADQLADSILGTHPELYQKYISIQSQTASPGIYGITETETASIRAALGEFLSRWIILERTFNIISANYSGVTSNALRGFHNLDHISDAIKLPKDRVADLRRFRVMRNQLVHGIEVPSRAFLNQAVEEFDELLSWLEHHQDTVVRDAYQRARQPLN
jgi:ppGpp synthetase/RelA/SpoT-type nucleotidyltranferase